MGHTLQILFSSDTVVYYSYEYEYDMILVVEPALDSFPGHTPKAVSLRLVKR